MSSANQISLARSFSKLAKGHRAITRKSVSQLALNLFLYATSCLILYSTNSALTLHVLLVIFCVFITVRLFIIQHDCAHQAFWHSKFANAFCGALLSSITHVPHLYWAKKHMYHHATSGNLDVQRQGDIWLMTTAEFHAASMLRQWAYRLYRNPVVMIILGGFFQFFIWFKLPLAIERNDSASRNSVIITNVLIAIRLSLLSIYFDFYSVLLIEFLVMWLAGMAAIILFYVQHNFEGAYWRRKTEWRSFDASVCGSTFLDLGRVGAWLTGYIGFHHIHHLNPKIPNYLLSTVHKNISSAAIAPKLISRITLMDVPTLFSFKLWDEEKGRMVKFS